MENSFFHGAKGATGLKSLDVDCEKHWIGWPGVCVEQKTEKDDICSTLWPLCHYFFAYTLYKRTFGNHIGKSMLFFVKRYLG